MRRAWFRSLAVLSVSLVTAAGVTAGTATAASSAEAAVHDVLTTSSQQVTSHWTADRMRSAIPFDRIAGKLPSVGDLGEVARGLPKIVPGQQPAAFPSSGEAWTGGGDVVSTTGRVFFDFNGQPSACSGSAVTSGNKSVVITAGHCVKYEGSWHTNWIFVPGYDNGAAPHGEWPARAVVTTPQWEESEDINYDVAAAVVEQVGGQSLTDVVGSQGIAFNQEYNQDMYAFGYPAQDPYDGESLTYCSGATIQDPLLSNDHGLSCDMTGGSSGGPWFLSFDEATGTGVQASVNSFGYVFLPGYMFGPYFGAEAQAVYEEAAAA